MMRAWLAPWLVPFGLGLLCGVLAAAAFIVWFLYRALVFHKKETTVNAPPDGSSVGLESVSADEEQKTEGVPRAFLSEQWKDSPPPPIPAYLEGYEEGGAYETCAWFGILLHRVLTASKHYFENGPLDLIAELNAYLQTHPPSPFFKGPVVRALELGTEPPFIYAVRVLKWRQQELSVEVCARYSGDASLSFSAALVADVLKGHLMELPMVFSLEEFRFDGTFVISFDLSPPEWSAKVVLKEQPQLGVKLVSKLGASFALKNKPHLKTMLLLALRTWIRSHLQPPFGLRFRFPSLPFSHSAPRPPAPMPSPVLCEVDRCESAPPDHISEPVVDRVSAHMHHLRRRSRQRWRVSPSAQFGPLTKQRFVRVRNRGDVNDANRVWTNAARRPLGLRRHRASTAPASPHDRDRRSMQSQLSAASSSDVSSESESEPLPAPRAVKLKQPPSSKLRTD